jgi:hypothetical protein
LKPNNLKEIVAQSRKVEPDNFSSLIKNCISILRKEQKDKKTNRDGGRLLHLNHSGEAIIVGDIHGDLSSLTSILKDSAFLKKAQQNKDVHLIFLGDYGDRGPNSPEVYYIILKLKSLFPEKVVLLRGNHEGPKDMIPYPYDLPKQFYSKFGIETGKKLLVELNKLFSRLYTSVIVKNRAILVHGGLPSTAKSTNDLAWAQKNHPKSSDLEEMLWNDPEDCLEGTADSPRGAGKLFGENITERLLSLFQVKVMIRGHQCFLAGFKFHHNGRILTLFSTNAYPYDNKHIAYLNIDLTKKMSYAHLNKSIRQPAE